MRATLAVRPLPRVPLGMTLVAGRLALVSGDERWANLEFSDSPLADDAPLAPALASLPFEARALGLDGARYWTTDRDTNEIVAFEPSASA